MLNTFEIDGKRYILLSNDDIQLFDNWLVDYNLRLAEEFRKLMLKGQIMSRADKTLALVGQLLDKWDELPNDVKSEPELEQVEKIMSQIETLVDDDSEELDVCPDCFGSGQVRHNNVFMPCISCGSAMSDKIVKAVIEQEIAWCEEHRGMKDEVYEEAFIAGLKQVLFFLNYLEQDEEE